MRYEQPGATIEFRFDGFATGLAGTFGVRLEDDAGDTAVDRFTAGISESPAGSGSYIGRITLPEDAGRYSLVADSGVVSPSTVASEPIVVTLTPTVLAPGESFASADDLAARLGVVLTASEQDRAETLLAAATALIQDETEQTISRVADDVLTRPGTSDDRILLPERPVISVASVTLDGSALADGSDWYLDGDEIVRIPSTVQGLLNGVAGITGGFGEPWQDLVVTYTHGYETVPQLCKQSALEAVVRVWVNPGAVIQEAVGDIQATYAPYSEPPAGLLLTRAEKRALRRRFGARAGSLSMGG